MLKISFGEGSEQKKGEEILINNVGFFSPKILFSMALVRCPPIVDTGIFFFSVPKKLQFLTLSQCWGILESHNIGDYKAF